MKLRTTILELARKSRKFQTSELNKLLPEQLSRQYISTYLGRMVKAGDLAQHRAGKYTFYSLPRFAHTLTPVIHKHLPTKGLAEHRVWEEMRTKATFLQRTPENIRSILAYAFSEMLNNAIDHSESHWVDIDLWQRQGMIGFTIRDTGIGVFRNVKQHRKLPSELDAMEDLLKGKTTTAPQAHSGEGIFFTSKAADLFELESFGYTMRVDNQIPDLFFQKMDHQLRGTKVTFQIKQNSNRHLNDIFKKFQSTPGAMAFDKTEIQIRLYTMGTIYVSRSQAKRVMSGLEKFQVIVLDFERVPTVGQAFADEIFRVFQSQHPTITIKPIHMNEAVAFMIGRVEKPGRVAKK